MNTQIRTLAALQAEKTKVKMQLEVSKREFFHSFGTTKTQAKDFIVKKVALPAGAISLATIGLKQLSNNNSNPNRTVVKKDGGIFFKIMPLILPLIRVILSDKDSNSSLVNLFEQLIAPSKKTNQQVDHK